MVNVVAQNPGPHTIRNVMASVHRIETNDASLEVGRDVIGAPLILAAPVDMHIPTPYTKDLHPGQEAEFEVADVNIVPANNAFHVVRDRKRIDPNTRQESYYSSSNAAIKAGKYQVTVVVRGEDVPPVYIRLVFDSTTDAVQISEIT